MTAEDISLLGLADVEHVKCLLHLIPRYHVILHVSVSSPLPRRLIFPLTIYAPKALIVTELDSGEEISTQISVQGI